MQDLQGELAAGRSVVVSLGANGEDQPGHFVTLAGISPDGEWVSYNDPTLGEQVISAEEFERLWSSQGNSGVAVRKEPPPEREGVDLSAWVALMAGLMAAVSMTPLGKERKGIGGMPMGAPTGGGKKPSSAAARSAHPSHVNASHGRAAADVAAKRAAWKKKGREKRAQAAAGARSRCLIERRTGQAPDPPEPPEVQKTPLQRFADQIIKSSFLWKLIWDPETSEILKNMRGLPDITLAFPIIRGMGYDDLAGPLLKEISLCLAQMEVIQIGR